MSFETDLQSWLHELEVRHLADLRFSEVSRALRALSATYVEHRSRLGAGAALSGAGKRAAFALFYAPLHAILVHHIATKLIDPGAARGIVIDLGCGTGAAGAALASAVGARELFGVDRHPWAVEEAHRTYRAFNLRGRTKVEDFTRTRLPEKSHALAAYAVNELPDERRHAFLQTVLAHASRGGRITVVEPLAGFVAPWWSEWRAAFESAGGRADEWRIRPELPPIVAKLDKAAGLNHREVTGRSLTI